MTIVILYYGNEFTRFKGCTGINTVDTKLIFVDDKSKRHVTTLPYEIIYETN